VTLRPLRSCGTRGRCWRRSTRLWPITALHVVRGGPPYDLAFNRVMRDHLFALRVFVRVARKGSFSAAGRDLNVPQSSVSRTIADLEREIGARLLVRTTRALTLTQAGADFLERIERILEELDEAEHVARGTGELKGLVRVGLGTSLGVREVIPGLPDFMARHPALKVDLVMQDHRQTW
jgi:DNA-binding transcriptional LysR family regulator